MNLSAFGRGHTYSRWIFTVTRNLADLAGEDFIDGMSQGVIQDVRIWKNKIHRANPVLCKADRYLAEFRRWAKQFYSAPAASTEDSKASSKAVEPPVARA